MAVHTLSLPLKMITALAGSAASAATLSYTAGFTRVSACTYVAFITQLRCQHAGGYADHEGYQSTACGWLAPKIPQLSGVADAETKQAPRMHAPSCRRHCQQNANEVWVVAQAASYLPSSMPNTGGSHLAE